MDPAVALVQAYLNLNGYFTVTEYPVLARAGSGARSITDLDVLAFRFPAAHHALAGRHPPSMESAPDDALGAPVGETDMILGEVKEGRARFNDAALTAQVLEVALSRFGCCQPEEADALARKLLSNGRVRTPSGQLLRMVAFGAPAESRRSWHVVEMARVVAFIRQYLEAHWEVFRHAQFKDSTLGFFAMLQKWLPPRTT